jgi:hypothetical protein
VASARAVASGALAFAVFGFVVGLSTTIQGGAAVDVSFHVVMLPLLVATLVALRKRGRRVIA